MGIVFFYLFHITPSNIVNLDVSCGTVDIEYVLLNERSKTTSKCFSVINVFPYTAYKDVSETYQHYIPVYPTNKTLDVKVQFRKILTI